MENKSARKLAITGMIFFATYMAVMNGALYFFNENVFDIIAAGSGSTFDDSLRFWVCLGLYVFLLLSFCIFTYIAYKKYAEYELSELKGADKFFKVYCTILFWVALWPIAILMTIISAVGSAVGSSTTRKDDKSKNLGSGYIERSGVTDYLNVDGQRIQLQDHNSYTGEAKDYDGNTYKIK